MTKQNESGQSLIELILTIGVAALLLPALLTGLIASRNGRAQQDQRLQAVALAKETQEAVRTIRETGWNSVATDGTYHPTISGTTWILANGPESINGFTRQIVISDVQRDTNGTIVASGGTPDPSTKQIVSTVSWNNPLPSSVSVTAYLTRYVNTSFTQTTVPDFSAGTLNGTTVATTSGSSIPNDGQVQLGSGGTSDWCSPNLSLTPLTLPGNGITTAISATTSANMDYAYTTTGGNRSGDSMDAISITHTSPSVANNAGAYNNFKTYGLFVDNPNQYVYLTSDHPGLTVDIVEVATQPYTETGTFTASQGGAGSSVTVAYNAFLGHDVGYVTAGNVFYTFDLAARTGSRPQLGFASLAGTGEKTIIAGNYAYVAVASNGEQLDIYDISNPNTPKQVSHIDVHNGEPATDLFVNATGTRVYLVTQQASQNTNDFFIIDTTNKVSTLPAPIGTFNTGAMSPTGVTVVPGGRAIIVGSAGEQYKVLNISTETAPVRCGGLTNPNGATTINAVASVIRYDGSAYSYILTNTASANFQMIAGGPGGQVSTSGTFESSTFDATNSAAFNQFSATINQPSQTTIQMQVAVASPMNGSCTGAAFTYVGPNGIGGASPSAYFSASGNKISGTIPFGQYGGYQNPNRCFRYKAYFNTNDISQTPILYDTTVNYSP